MQGQAMQEMDRRGTEGNLPQAVTGEDEYY